MLKQRLSLLLVIALLVSLLPRYALRAYAEEAAAGTCGANLNWTFDASSETLTILGNGDMYDYNLNADGTSEAPWSEHAAQIDRIVFPDGLTKIGSAAFCNTKIVEAVIPDQVTVIGAKAFWQCDALTDLVVPRSVTQMGNGCVDGTGVGFRLHVYSDSYALQYAVQNEIPYLLMDGTIPSVSGICGAEGNGSNLTWTLNPNTGLLTVSGSGAMKDYDYGAAPWFTYRQWISTLSLSNGLTSIGERAFENCNSLNRVTIPASVTSIHSCAFSFCTALTNVSIPANVSSIGDFAFYACSALTAIDVATGNANYSSQDGVLFDKARTKLIQYPAGKTTASYTLPNSVKQIGDGAFFGCAFLTGVTISDNVTRIGEGTFDNCAALRHVTIGNAVTNIDNDAFLNCSALTGVTIPASVSRIGNYAFYGCTALRGVSIPVSVTEIGTAAFGYCDSSDGNQVKVEGFTIYGEEGSAAQRYAVGNGFLFSTQAAVSQPVITTQPQSVSAAAGNPVSFTVAATGTNLRYQWQYKKAGEGSWTDWSGKTAATLRFNAVSGSNGCQYRCVVTNDAGSATSGAATLTVLSKPVITTQPQSVSAAAGNPVSFTVAATGENLRYQWQYKKAGEGSWTDWSGKTAATLRFNAVSGSNGCQYRCVVTNNAGSATSGAATLTVLSKPVITTQPQSVRAAAGNPVSFTVAATGENLRYQWQYKKAGEGSWTDWSGKTAATLRFNAVSGSNGCQYRCVVTNDAGSATSGAATLTVLSKPVITTQPQSVSAAVGNPVSFTVAATGENLRYQWQYKKAGEGSWTDWSGKTAATLRFNAVSGSNGCQYRCVVSNDAGSATSGAATLTVLSKPVITTQPQSVSAAVGNPVSFTVAATGENLRYQWQYKKAGEGSWTDWSGKTAATLRFNAVSGSNGCQYRCVVTNDAGSATSTAAILYVVSA